MRGGDLRERVVVVDGRQVRVAAAADAAADAVVAEVAVRSPCEACAPRQGHLCEVQGSRPPGQARTSGIEEIFPGWFCILNMTLYCVSLAAWLLLMALFLFCNMILLPREKIPFSVVEEDLPLWFRV